jgi:hypothetical protein
LALLSIFLALPVHAAPLLDVQRLAFGIGGSYDWHGGNLDPAPPHRSELCVNGFGAYSLTEHFSSSVRVAYGAGNRTFRASPGIHYNIGVGGEAFAVALSYDFYAGDFDPAFPNEWVVSAIYSRPIGKHIIFSAVEGWGFDNHENRTSVQLTAPLWVGKDKD